MLLAILAVWFVWSNLVRDSIFKDCGYNIVNWRDSSSNMDVPEACMQTTMENLYCKIPTNWRQLSPKDSFLGL